MQIWLLFLFIMINSLWLPEYTGEGVTVGIIDSGIDFSSSRLEDNYGGWKDFINGSDKPTSKHLHGSYVADVLVQKAPDVEVVGAKVNDDGESFMEDKIEAKEYFINKKEVDIVIIPRSGGCLDTVEKMREAGILVITSAGNDYKVKRSKEAFAVSAFDENGNYIYEHDYIDTAIQNGITVGDYGDGRYTAYGSSYTAPQVAGMASRLIQEAEQKGEDISVSDLEDSMRMKEFSYTEARNYLFIDK